MALVTYVPLPSVPLLRAGSLAEAPGLKQLKLGKEPEAVQKRRSALQWPYVSTFGETFI